VAFVYISDDMQWGKKNLRKVENIFFLGCGDSEDPGKSLQDHSNLPSIFFLTHPPHPIV
jgi:hypothetical protein